MQLSKVAILLGICLVFGGSALAQDKNATPASTEPKPVVAAAAAPANASPSPAKNDSSAKPADSYKESLNSLSTLYQNEAQRLEKQNEQLKGLFKDGLVAKVDVDASDKALADAKAKVDEVARQIAEANKPAPAVVDSVTALTASNQAWSTGNTRVDGLIKFYANQNGIDPYLVFCLMNQESRFTSGAVSPKGAMGLM